MKTIVTFFALIFFLNLSIQAQESGPSISFSSLVIDYGEIDKGSDGIRTFEFTNTGTQPLVIAKVYSSCGCTIPKKPDAPIAPGEKGEIQVKYDTNRVGPIRKTITVNSNAMDTPIVSLKIKGTVL
ncbi:DUF1573 domain-containing protein [Flavobacteriaceae bacterium]|nr:DUF1573 domain-containing protein [Flavobacteriaceae bacterium]